jgi:hypothetical protein
METVALEQPRLNRALYGWYDSWRSAPPTELNKPLTVTNALLGVGQLQLDGSSNGQPAGWLEQDLDFASIQVFTVGSIQRRQRKQGM